MGIADELMSNPKYPYGSPPLTIYRWGGVIIFLLIAAAFALFGFKGISLAVFGKETEATITGAFYSGGRHESKNMSYSYSVSGGITFSSSTDYDDKIFKKKKLPIRYLVFLPWVNDLVHGGRGLELIRGGALLLSCFFVLGILKGVFFS